MTNGEKLDQIFPNGICPFSKKWLDCEYKKSSLSSALEKNSEKLENSTTKNNLGVDCISRTQAIERLKLNFPISQGADNSRDRHRYMQAQADLQAIRELPSVTPQEPKTGHWIWCVGSHKCSNCEEYTCFSHKELLRYCPNCGAKMVEPQESEDKE